MQTSSRAEIFKRYFFPPTKKKGSSRLCNSTQTELLQPNSQGRSLAHLPRAAAGMPPFPIRVPDLESQLCLWPSFWLTRTGVHMSRKLEPQVECDWKSGMHRWDAGHPGSIYPAPDVHLIAQMFSICNWSNLQMQKPTVQIFSKKYSSENECYKELCQLNLGIPKGG